MDHDSIVCFYHKVDLDGKCAGAIVNYFRENVTLVPFDYNDEIPWDIINSKTIVIMTDCSASREDMIRLNKESYMFIWIDHHSHKIEELKDLSFEGIRRDGTAACILTWEYFAPQNNILPKVVELLGRFDVWDLDDDVLSFQYGMRRFDCSPSNEIFWRDLLDDNSGNKANIIADEGMLLYNYIKQNNKTQVNGLGFIKEFRDYKVLLVNRGYINSLFFNDHPEKDNVDIYLAFSWNGKMWKISMYTPKDDVDVSKICFEFGGGGHKKASGLYAKKLPQEIHELIFGTGENNGNIHSNI